jgi:hypothetical protein
MKSLRVIVPIVLLGAACGTEAPTVDATLEAPSPAEARISISAALEVSDLLDVGIAERIVIEDITVNLAEVRLLAADPRIPPGGYSLLSRETLLEFYGAEDSKLELAFPEQFLAQEDLAVYLRIKPTEALASSSIVVSGRYYATPIGGGPKQLKSTDDRTGASDPDGDPVMPGDERKAHNDSSYDNVAPDTDDPTQTGCASDPDGDPVMCGRSNLTGGATGEEASVAFELRTSDIADLVATLGSDSALNVVVGIPASQWFTEDVITSLNRALAGDAQSSTREDDNQTKAEEVIVVDSAERATSERMKQKRDDYFVTDHDLDDLTVRR